MMKEIKFTNGNKREIALRQLRHWFPDVKFTPTGNTTEVTLRLEQISAVMEKLALAMLSLTSVTKHLYTHTAVSVYEDLTKAVIPVLVESLDLDESTEMKELQRAEQDAHAADALINRLTETNRDVPPFSFGDEHN
jgi:predicted transcriptional regulator